MANLQLTVSDEVAQALQTLIQSLSGVQAPVIAPTVTAAPAVPTREQLIEERKAAFMDVLTREMPKFGFSVALTEVIVNRLYITSNTGACYWNIIHLYKEVRHSTELHYALLAISASWRLTFGCGTTSPIVKRWANLLKRTGAPCSELIRIFQAEGLMARI